MLCRIGFVALDINSKCSAFGAGARQAVNYSCALVKKYSYSLVLGDAAIHRIDVAEIIGEFNFVITKSLTDQFGCLVTQGIGQILCAVDCQGFVVVSGIIIASESAPVLGQDIGDRLTSYRQYIKPEKYCP